MIYDIPTNKWRIFETIGGPNFSRRSGHGQCVYNDRFLYIFGGDFNAIYNDEMYLIDLLTQEITMLQTKLPMKMSCFGYLLKDDHIFIFGGCCSRKYFSNLYKFDINNETWMELKAFSVDDRYIYDPMNNNTFLRGMLDTSLDRGLISNCGMNGFIELTSTEVVNGYSEGGRCGNSLFCLGNKLLSFGGFLGNNMRTNQIIEYDLVSNTWKELKMSGEYPRETCYQGCLLFQYKKGRKNVLWVFGGYCGSFEHVNDVHVVCLSNEYQDFLGNLLKNLSEDLLCFTDVEFSYNENETFHNYIEENVTSDKT